MVVCLVVVWTPNSDWTESIEIFYIIKNSTVYIPYILQILWNLIRRNSKGSALSITIAGNIHDIFATFGYWHNEFSEIYLGNLQETVICYLHHYYIRSLFFILRLRTIWIAWYDFPIPLIFLSTRLDPKKNITRPSLFLRTNLYHQS